MSGIGQTYPQHRAPAVRLQPGYACAVSASQPPSAPCPRVALAHDYLLVMRGAERTFAAIADLYSRAPIFTLLYDERGTHGRFARSRDHDLAAAAPRRRPGQASGACCRSTRSRSSACAPPAVRRRAEQQQRVRARPARARGRGARLLLPRAVSLRLVRAGARAQRDAGAAAPAARACSCAGCAGGTSRRAAASTHTSPTRGSRGSGSRRFYGRDAPIIHPPVETHRFAPASPASALLVVSELVAPQARARRARGRAARRAPIRVVGSGPEHAALSEALPRGRVPRPRQRRGARRAVRERARGDRPEHGGVRDHRRRGAGGGTAGDRRRRRRRARDGASTARRAASRGSTTSSPSRARSRPSTRLELRPRTTPSRTPRASRSRRFSSAFPSTSSACSASGVNHVLKKGLTATVRRVITERPCGSRGSARAPQETGGAPGVVTELLDGLSRRGHGIDCFFPGVGVKVPEHLAERENLNFIWGTSGWRWDRWYSRTKLTSFATGLLSRAVASVRLRREIARRHRARPV